jgi:hypothetical protein
MARTLNVPGPLDTLEEAFDLLQRAPAVVWLRYLCGAAPLIVGLLFVWNQFSMAESATLDPLLASLFLLVLVVWFYHSRQIFAAQLRGILTLKTAGAPPRTWWAACFEGSKLLVVPLTVLSVLPLAYITGFYRSLTLFATEGLPPRETLAKAWKAGAAWQRENWLILAILNLLGLIVLVNITLTVMVAPILVKMFTGYENISTEHSSAGAMMPIILVLTWLSFDPLLQAVYTVRAFHWEGLRTGEDLFVRMKRLAPAILLLVCFSGPCFAGGQTTKNDGLPHGLNRAIDQVLQGPEYNWRIPPDDLGEEKKDWFVDTVDRTLAVFRKIWKAISDLWSDALGWLRRMLSSGQPATEKVTTGKPNGVRPVFYLIGLGIVAVALVLLWKFRPRKTPEAIVSAATGAVDLTKEGVLASDLPEDEWLAMAERYAASGDLRLALRALYLGTLALLNRRGLVTIHACKSNRDYEGELHRRSRDNGLTQIFHLNLRSFERSWYGFHEVTGEQLQLFRDNLGRMRS